MCIVKCSFGVAGCALFAVCCQVFAHCCLLSDVVVRCPLVVACCLQVAA